MYLKPLIIGNVKLKNNIVLAPMAGVTDLPFRIICQDFGMGLQYTEMASAKAIYYGDKNTKRLLDLTGQSLPVAVQLFGAEPDIIAEAIQKIQDTKFKNVTDHVGAGPCVRSNIKSQFDIIDINMGCPAPKVTKNGDGSSLLKNLNLIYEIVKKAVEVSNVPVTVKIRKGWDNDNVVAVEAAKLIQTAGASAITIHGRTRDEFYTR